MLPIASIRTSLALAGFCAVAAGPAWSQAYPTKPVKMMVSGSPGGSNDTIARFISQKLSERWGQSVVVENRSGASGAIAVGAVAKSPPDGYTLGNLGASTLVGLVTSTELKRDFDFRTSFAPISQLVSQPYIFVVTPSLPVTSIKEFIAYAKARPGELNFGSLGDNTATHNGMQLFADMAGIKMTHVPYKSTPAVTGDVVTGRIHALLGGALSSMPLVRAGKMRALAVTSASRSKSVPDLPTVSEGGVTGFELAPWFGLMAPAKTPPGIIAKIHKDTVASMEVPQVREQFAKTGTEVVTSDSPAEFQAMLNREIERWEKFAKARAN
jgi:tripartite-type tricarboxylate transporter receptor subunit TctC